VQVTFESTEPVEQVAAVLSALYQVPIAVRPAADQPSVTPSTHVTAENTAAKTTEPGRKTATPKKVATAGRSRRIGRGSAAPVDAAAVRVWARNHGITVSPRGALSENVVTTYQTATA